MRYPSIAVIVCLIYALGFVGLVFGQTPMGINSDLVFELTNQNRASKDLQELNFNQLLASAAQMKADDMASRGYFAHTSPVGRTPWNWITKAGYNYAYAGENIAVNYLYSQDVVQGWMDSPTHRANILNSHFTEMGIAWSKGRYNGHDAIFVVQMLGHTASAKKPVAVTKPKITLKAKALVTLPKSIKSGFRIPYRLENFF